MNSRSQGFCEQQLTAFAVVDDRYFDSKGIYAVR